MPFAIGAAIATAVGLSAAAGTAIGVGISLVVTVGLSFLSRALAERPKPAELPDFSFRQEAGQRINSVLDPTEPWRLIIGRVRTGGVVRFREMTGDRKTFWQVAVVAAHRCKAIDTFWLDDYPIYPDQLNADGWVTVGKFANKARFVVDLGTTGQPFPDFVGLAVEWTDAHRMAGHTKVWSTYIADRNLFPRQPNISFTIRGAIIDETDENGVIQVSRWSQNWAWCQRWYMALPEEVGGVDIGDKINNAECVASAAVSDEIVGVRQKSFSVTVNTGIAAFELADELCEMQTGDVVHIDGTPPGGFSSGVDYFVIVARELANEDRRALVRLAATLDNAYDGVAIVPTDVGSSVVLRHVGEPRYTLNGVIRLDREPRDILFDMAKAGSAFMPIYSGGEYIFQAGRWIGSGTPVTTDQVVGKISVIGDRPTRDRYNSIQGTFSSPQNYGELTDYPAVIGSVFEAQDKRRIFRTHDQPFVSRKSTTRRLAWIELFRHRREIVVDLQMNLAGLKFRPGDIVSYTDENYGWTNKTFEITALQLLPTNADGDAVRIAMTWAEVDSGIYDWDPNLQDQIWNPATRSRLPNIGDVPEPISLSWSTVLTDVGAQGSTTPYYELRLDWDVNDGFVDSDGSFNAEIRENGTSRWETAFSVDGEARSGRFSPVKFGARYDFRVQARNRFGALSNWATRFNVAVGTADGGATELVDYGIRSDPKAPTGIDYGIRSEPKGPTVDYGTWGT